VAWLEQRQFNKIALGTLLQANHPLAPLVQAELAAIEPSRPSTSNYTRVTKVGQQFTCNGVKIGFDATGAINSLVDRLGDIWANTTSPLGKLVYTTWNETGYNASSPCNLVLGGKYHSDEAGPENRDWFTSLVSLWQRSENATGQSCSFLAQVRMDSITTTKYGGFPEGWITYSISSGGPSNTVISIDYQWFAKTSTRLAESFMLSFTPVQQFGYSWTMDKLGTPISPLEVIKGGNQNQHAVWNGVLYSSTKNFNATSMRIWSKDVPLVSPVTTKIPATPLVPSVDPLSGQMLGFAYNIYNNIWSTNYIFWYPLLTGEGADEKFRFQIELGPGNQGNKVKGTRL